MRHRLSHVRVALGNSRVPFTLKAKELGGARAGEGFLGLFAKDEQ
jgi:hypothetical protein